MASPTSPLVLRGAARPRLELAPPYDYSLGDEAAELMRLAGKPLDPWQVDSCRLMMAVRDGRWACMDYAEWVARQNGKGALLEARALAGLFLFGEDLVAWSAHEYKTAMEAFRRVKGLIRRLGTVVGENLISVDGVLVKVINTNGEESFERLDTGQRIKFLARSKGSGRGFTASVQLIDEAFAYTALQQQALAPTTLAVVDEQTVYMSTPPLDGGAAEPMYTLRERADAGGDDSLGYRDWGLGGWLEDRVGVSSTAAQFVNVDDRELWAATCPAVGIRITEQKLLGLRRKLGHVGFGREVLGLWPRRVAGSNRVIDVKSWQSRGGAEGRPDGSVALAVEAAWPDGEAASIGLAGRLNGELLVQVVDHHPGSSWVVGRVTELAGRHRPCAVVVDAGGPAGFLADELRKALEPLGTPVVTPNVREIARAAAQFHAAAAGDEPTLRHYGQPELDAAVAAAEKRPLGDAWTWARKGLTDVSPLVAVTLAVHGLSAFKVIDVAASIW